MSRNNMEEVMRHGRPPLSPVKDDVDSEVVSLVDARAQRLVRQGGMGGALAFEVPDGVLVCLAGYVVEMLNERLIELANDDPWHDVEEAAEYMRCKGRDGTIKPDRIYDLKAQGRLRFEKDGGRLLFRQSWLDACLESGGSGTLLGEEHEAAPHGGNRRGHGTRRKP